MKHFYISACIEECAPDYDFVLQAETIEQARKQARNIIDQDYPDCYRPSNFETHEVTGDELLKLMTLN